VTNNLTFLRFIVYRTFLHFLTLCNTSFLTRLVQIYSSIFLETTFKSRKIFLIYFHNCPSFSILQTGLHWFLPYIICSFSRICLYLVSGTHNEDFALSHRGLLDDNVSASVNALWSQQKPPKDFPCIDPFYTPLNLLFCPSLPAHFTTFSSSQAI